MYNLKISHNGEQIINNTLIQDGTTMIESYTDSGDVYEIEITIKKKEAHQCDCPTPCSECKCCKR